MRYRNSVNLALGFYLRVRFRLSTNIVGASSMKAKGLFSASPRPLPVGLPRVWGAWWK